MSTYKHIAMEFARYNRWQNGVLLGFCDGIGQEELDRDRGAFFRSLSGTLSHILHVDRVLLEMV